MLLTTLLPIIIFFFILGILVITKKIALWVFIGYVILSFVTYIVYAVDKSAAKKSRRRIPEKTLHLLSLFGGWSGAMLAQQTLRHKSQKQPFRFIFWCSLFFNLSFMTSFMWRSLS